jgi:lipoprotein-anchoring transpeptidase ErfK/SrfK
VPGGQAPAPLTLTAADRRDCPAAAMACVDLAAHLTWLQAGGRVTFGPVQMEPGEPGSAHQTPRGTFHVAWKAGPAYVSDIYREAMPWATFFAVGGIAFHGGSLTQWSHGCVHLTLASARYYNVHLPVGAEVFVF